MSIEKKATINHQDEVVSFTECTGLMMTVPETKEEDKASAGLYGIHRARRPENKPGKR